MAFIVNKPGDWQPPDQYIFTCYMRELIRRWHAATLQVIQDDEEMEAVGLPLIQGELRTALTVYHSAIAGWSDLDELLDEATFSDERIPRIAVTIDLAREHK
jgi:hypothetical protein